MRPEGSRVTFLVVVVATLPVSAAQPANPINARIDKPKVAFMFPCVPNSESNSCL
jgi:hypothetical protein